MLNKVVLVSDICWHFWTHILHFSYVSLAAYYIQDTCWIHFRHISYFSITLLYYVWDVYYFPFYIKD